MPDGEEDKNKGNRKKLTGNWERKDGSKEKNRIRKEEKEKRRKKNAPPRAATAALGGAGLCMYIGYLIRV